MRDLTDNKAQILELLQNRPRGATISEISEQLGISRPTASKYLEILVAEGEVDQREVGNAKLHYPSQELELAGGPVE